MVVTDFKRFKKRWHPDIDNFDQKYKSNVEIGSTLVCMTQSSLTEYESEVGHCPKCDKVLYECYCKHGATRKSNSRQPKTVPDSTALAC